MASVQCLRGFISERLTAAAEEIFTVFEKTILQYEEEVARQRRLLDVVLKPEIRLHRIELPQQHASDEEEVLIDQQLCSEERNSSLDQENPEPGQIKGEQQEMGISPAEKQLVLKQETETLMLTPDNEESDPREPESEELPQQHASIEEEVVQQLCKQERNSSLDQENPEPRQIQGEQEEMCISPEEEQLVLKQETETLMLTPDYEESVPREPESEGEHQLLSHNSTVAESQNQNRRKHVESGSTRKEEPNPQKSLHENRSHSKNVYISEITADTHSSGNSFKCDKGYGFMYKHQMKIHLRNYTGEKPYLCKICHKSFIGMVYFKVHMRSHIGEKPYSCKTCGKRFSDCGHLKIHMRIHSDDKPYSCQTCQTSFGEGSQLNDHMITHTDEEPATRDKSFS